jgi:hypothetical protein
MAADPGEGPDGGAWFGTMVREWLALRLTDDKPAITIARAVAEERLRHLSVETDDRALAVLAVIRDASLMLGDHLRAEEAQSELVRIVGPLACPPRTRPPVT